VDQDALCRILECIGALAEDLPAVKELDLNPVMVGPGGAVAVDARIRVERAAPPLPLGAR